MLKRFLSPTLWLVAVTKEPREQTRFQTRFKEKSDLQNPDGEWPISNTNTGSKCIILLKGMFELVQVG